MSLSGRELRSTISENGDLVLSLEQVGIPDPQDDEIVVRVQAAPINPSDLGLLLGPADLSTLKGGEGSPPRLMLSVPPHRLPAVRSRLGKSLPVGNEGAGTVIAAGKDAKALEGRIVGMWGGAMYADYRKIRARDAVPLPAGATAGQGASMFVNPLTALGFLETARAEGHRAIVHTAAASNLGQMLQKLCLAEGMPLINIVRSQAQVEILRQAGGTCILNSSDDDYRERLVAAIAELDATVVFDAVGGGASGSDILAAMERASVQRMTSFSRYGSDTFKQLYIYGALDMSRTSFDRSKLGFQWGISGWLLTNFLKKAGPDGLRRMTARIVDELTTTFASHYSRVIGLAEALQPDVLRAYERKATGEKFLIDPTRG
jgi:NADPH:quinone reductase-like Zn-dependent oxidoreductase